MYFNRALLLLAALTANAAAAATAPAKASAAEEGPAAFSSFEEPTIAKPAPVATRAIETKPPPAGTRGFARAPEAAAPRANASRLTGYLASEPKPIKGQVAKSPPKVSTNASVKVSTNTEPRATHKTKDSSSPEAIPIGVLRNALFDFIGNGTCQDSSGVTYNYATYAPNAPLVLSTDQYANLIGYMGVQNNLESVRFLLFEDGYLVGEGGSHYLNPGSGNCPENAESCQTFYSGSSPIAGSSGQEGFTCYRKVTSTLQVGAQVKAETMTQG